MPLVLVAKVTCDSVAVILLGILTARRCDLCDVDGRAGGSTRYNGIIRVGRKYEQMSAFEAAEHDRKDGSFRFYLSVDFTAFQGELPSKTLRQNSVD